MENRGQSNGIDIQAKEIEKHPAADAAQTSELSVLP